MAFGAATIMRRGVEYSNLAFSNPPKDGQPPTLPKVPAWAVLLVLVTILIFGLLFFTVNYCLGTVVATLTMIESNQPDAYLPVDTLPSNDDEDNTPKPASAEPLLEPEALLVKNSPITASVRRTLHHLRARYGSFSPFRGLSLFLCLGLARSFLIQFFGIPRFMNNWIGFSLASIVSDLILARWSMTWIHIVISEPSPKRFWQRALPLKSWVKIAPAVALSSVASQITIILPWMVGVNVGVFRRLRNPDAALTRSDINAAFAQVAAILLLSLLFSILIQLPATVVLVRVAASMLPEENEAVVPFDRSFSGKVTPAILGGQGKIGMLEAWKSFDWSSRIRLLKLMGKVAAIVVALWVFSLLVVAVEANLIVGSKNMKAILEAVREIINGNAGGNGGGL